MMCLGSEELGDRLDADTLRCRRCGQSLPSYSPTYDLVPVHDRYDQQADPPAEEPG